MFIKKKSLTIRWHARRLFFIFIFMLLLLLLLFNFHYPYIYVNCPPMTWYKSIQNKREKNLQVLEACSHGFQLWRILAIQWKYWWHTKCLVQKGKTLSRCVGRREGRRRRWRCWEGVSPVSWSITNRKGRGRCGRWWCWTWRLQLQPQSHTSHQHNIHKLYPSLLLVCQSKVISCTTLKTTIAWNYISV